MEYKVGYIDISYQDRKILTVLRKHPHGSAEMLRAAVEDKNRNRVRRSLRLTSISGKQFDKFDLFSDSGYSEELLSREGQIQNTEIHGDMMSAVTTEYLPYPVILKRYLLGVEIPDHTGPVREQIVLSDLTEEQREIVDQWIHAARVHASEWV